MNVGFLIISSMLGSQQCPVAWSIETFTRMTNFDCSEQSAVCVVRAKHSKRVINSMVRPIGAPMFRIGESVESELRVTAIRKNPR